MRIIINGGGAGNQVKEAYTIFAKEVQNRKILYIPLAWENGDYEDCYKWLTEELKAYGLTNLDFVKKAEELTNDRLKDVGGIFIGGGNTFKLLKMLKESVAYENIKNYAINNKGIILGGSAGAIIFGKTIRYSHDENKVKLTDFNGFDFFDGYTIYPHYEKISSKKDQEEKDVNALLKRKVKLICLPEETSIYLNGKKAQVIGQKSAIVTNSGIKKTENPDKYIKLITQSVT